MKRNIQFVLLLLSMPIAVSTQAVDREGRPANTGGPRGPHLSEEQRTCIDQQLGGAPHEVKATHKQISEAAEYCGVEFEEPHGGERNPPDRDPNSD